MFVALLLPLDDGVTVGTDAGSEPTGVGESRSLSPSSSA
jgi:hypothetical protein